MSDLITAAQFQSLQKLKAKPKKDSLEHDLQCQVVSDFDRDYPRYAGLLFAIPNGAKLPFKKNKKGQRICPEAIKLKREGLRPGVPDLCLPVPKGRFHGLYVEMKFGDNRPTAEQKVFMQRLMQLSYRVEVCYTREQASRLFKSYLNLPCYQSISPEETES